MNLSSVRENSRDKLKSTLVRNLIVFSHLLLIANLQRSIRKVIARSGLAINSSHRYIPDTSAKKRIGSTIVSTRKYRNSLAIRETTSSRSRIVLAPTLHPVWLVAFVFFFENFFAGPVLYMGKPRTSYVLDYYNTYLMHTVFRILIWYFLRAQE